MADSRDILNDIRATMDEIERPWAAFIGLVALRTSPYVRPGETYALNFTPVIGDNFKGQAALLHPDDIEPTRAAVQQLTRRKVVSDAEIAAFIYYAAHESRKQK